MKLLAAITALFRRPAAPPAPEPVVDNVVKLKPVLDSKVQAIRKIATLRLARKAVPWELLDGLSDARVEWLRALDVQMLLKLSRASQHRIREHLAGRRAIRGVLAADPESVKAYKEAMKPRISVVDHKERRGGGGGPQFRR